MFFITADPQWEVTVLLRVADLFDRLGDHEDAIALQCRAMGLMGGVDSMPSSGKLAKAA